MLQFIYVKLPVFRTIYPGIYEDYIKQLHGSTICVILHNMPNLHKFCYYRYPVIWPLRAIYFKEIKINKNQRYFVTLD